MIISDTKVIKKGMRIADAIKKTRPPIPHCAALQNLRAVAMLFRPKFNQQMQLIIPYDFFTTFANQFKIKNYSN